MSPIYHIATPTALSVFVLAGVITTLCSAYVTQIMCNFEMGILHFCCTKMVFLRMTYRGPLCGVCGGVGVGVWCGVECGVVWCVVWCVVCGVVWCVGVNIVRVQQ